MAMMFMQSSVLPQIRCRFQDVVVEVIKKLSFFSPLLFLLAFINIVNVNTEAVCVCECACVRACDRSIYISTPICLPPWSLKGYFT